MYLRRRPHPSLAGYIDYYWYVSDTPKDELVHIVPSGTLEVVVHLHEDTIRICDSTDPSKLTCYSGAVVSGAQGRYFTTDVRAHAVIIGVHFRAGGAFPLLGVAPGALSDEHANLDAIWGSHAIELRERLCAAGSAEDKFRILDGEFARRLCRAPQPRDEVRFALRQLLTTNARVDNVAAAVELSNRRFIEIFSEEVGTTPKVFSRVGRFQRALTRAKQGVSPNWPQLALTYGYFDQSHLIREFVSLSGLAPTELVRRSAAAPGHHAALAERRR